METTFYIQLNVKTPDGPECYGRFNIGNDKENALRLFRTLKGNILVDETNFLFMELMEVVDGLPVNLQLRCCTLDELAQNCRTISKEVFQMANLKL